MIQWTSTPTQRFRNVTKAVDSRPWQGAHHSDTSRYRADVQRRHGREGTFSGFEISVSVY